MTGVLLSWFHRLNSSHSIPCFLVYPWSNAIDFHSNSMIDSLHHAVCYHVIWFSSPDPFIAQSCYITFSSPRVFGSPMLPPYSRHRPKGGWLWSTADSYLMHADIVGALPKGWTKADPARHCRRGSSQVRMNSQSQSLGFSEDGHLSFVSSRPLSLYMQSYLLGLAK